MVSTNKSGFSLMELLVAIAILGIIAGVGIPAFMNYLKKARVKRAEGDLRLLKNQIDMFKMDTGKYPSKLIYLVKRPRDPKIAKKWLGGVIPKKGKGGYLPKLPVDPWGNAYQYKPVPDKDNDYTLFSYGSEGKRSRKGRINAWDIE